MTQEQTDAVAKAFEAQANAARNSQARAVPRMYRCVELMQIESWQRIALVNAVRRDVAERWSMRSIWILWGMLCLASWWYVPAVKELLSGAGLLALAFAIPSLIHHNAVRRRIKELIRAG